MACLILPVLLPLNKVGGKGTHYKHGDSGPKWNVTGLDQLSWGNIIPENTDRYWGHLVMAVILIIYVCAIFFDELKGYIRLRQAFLTSPQHRLRASATTVLVTAIPRKWLSFEALEGLYDVFPGGIRNIWINRNFDDLNEKVKLRNDLALKLESAETNLIANCKKAQLKAEMKAVKKAGKKGSDESKKAEDRTPSQQQMENGVSSGNPHQDSTVDEVLSHDNPERQGNEAPRRNVWDPAFGAVGAVGQGMGKAGISAVGGVMKATDGKPAQRGLGRGFVPEHMMPASHTGGRSNAGDEDPVAKVKAARPSETDAPHDASAAAPSDAPENGSDPTPKKASWKTRVSPNSKSKTKLAADEYPLTAQDTQDTADERASARTGNDSTGGKDREDKEDDPEEQQYPIAYNEDFDNEDFGEPAWKKYIKPKDRETMRLPIYGLRWMPSLPLLGQKVDIIDHCRKEVARLNVEIEIDQQQPEKYPLMRSAFIQFNHQVAAHMACQAVSHHVPKQMAPRIVEISPDDVIWDNMSITWWERYIRTFGIILLVCAMVVGWAFPVAFTGLLSQLSYLEHAIPWLRWIGQLPDWFLSAIQGILPPLFLAILMAVLPLILRFLTRTQGVHTGMHVELTVQNYYFAFLFVQLFLVVAISASFSTVFNNITRVTSWPELLAQNIPASSNYFFSYMILQAMSHSAAALLQIITLIGWFILAPIFDSTARKKWGRTTNLNQMQWGSFFPVYTTLASIGMFIRLAWCI